MVHFERSRFALGIVVACTAILASCGEEIVVRTDSRVYAEGGISRRIEISGKEADGSVPPAPDWLETHAGVDAGPAERFFRNDVRKLRVDLLPSIRTEMARAISTRKRPVAADELAFWPIGDEAQARVEATLQAEAGSALDALGGYYGRGSTPRFRFDSRLRLPGRLVRALADPLDPQFPPSRWTP